MDDNELHDLTVGLPPGSVITTRMSICEYMDRSGSTGVAVRVSDGSSGPVDLTKVLGVIERAKLICCQPESWRQP